MNYNHDKITFIHGDCMDYMADLPDNAFDLAIVDPPYGIGVTWKKDRHSKFYKHNSTYNNTRVSGEYFEQLFRVSKNQIIWGANYYIDYLPSNNHWIVWDKERDYPTQHASEGELAWHSFNIPLRIVRMIWNGAVVIESRYGKHPHEKPVSLYKWILKNYATPDMKIIDTHLGSGSSAIAAYDFGCEFVGIEIDEEYYNAAVKRFRTHAAQQKLFK